MQQPICYSRICVLLYFEIEEIKRCSLSLLWDQKWYWTWNIDPATTETNGSNSRQHLCCLVFRFRYLVKVIERASQHTSSNYLGTLSSTTGWLRCCWQPSVQLRTHRVYRVLLKTYYISQVYYCILIIYGSIVLLMRWGSWLNLGLFPS